MVRYLAIVICKLTYRLLILWLVILNFADVYYPHYRYYAKYVRIVIGLSLVGSMAIVIATVLEHEHDQPQRRP
jgi:hypothetical protein